MKWSVRSLFILLLLGLPLAACSLDGAGDEENGENECELGTVSFRDALEQHGDTRHVHDPVVAKHGDQYVLFSTGHGVPIRHSEDLVQWTLDGEVFDGDYPSWAPEEVPGVEFPWAPDISFFNDRYHLYYSLSTFGDQRSVIGLATNPTLDPEDADYEWEDHGKVVESRPGDDYNAIDPNVAFDEDDWPWLVWGSYWDGIKMRRLDPETGLPSEDDTEIHSLAARPDEDAIEAPFIVRHDGHYYLFVSFDTCCDGAASTYKIVVGRSEDITGPYVDRDGTPMMEGGGTLVLAGYGRIRGPGHNAVFAEDDRHYLVHHFYDANDSEEAPELQVRSLLWDEDGWPLAGEPYDGTDPLDFGDDTPDLTGRWGHAIDFSTPEQIAFSGDGQVERCDDDGEWSLSDSTLTLRWPSGDGSDEEWSCHCIVASDGTWYVGRDQDGRVVRGWKIE